MSDILQEVLLKETEPTKISNNPTISKSTIQGIQRLTVSSLISNMHLILIVSFEFN